MTKKMLINATHPEENRVAIVEDGVLSELDIEIAGREQTRGNIYKAVVVRVETGLQAAFVDYGAERLGFLQIGEIHPSFFKTAESSQDNRSKPRINDLLRRGQEILVQVVKEERGTKGAALTTYLSLPGRYMVLMPDSDTKGISRKIEQEGQRKKIREIMNSLDLPADIGYIVRTAGIGQKKEELKRDFNYLLRVLEKIRTLEKQLRAPALIYKESNLVIRSIRDYFSPEMEEILVDDPKVFQEAVDFFQVVMPEYARMVKLHQERRPIFARYQIEEQIETITRNKVSLTSGGSIVIDSTEALVAIDVNSGKMSSEQNVEATAYKTNLEAADEVARQLRLRDLGGLIIIDFIDMRDRKHIREVEKRLKDALKADKARVTVGKISQFGLLEMSRQRIKATLAEASFRICPHCEGTGRIKSPEAQAVAFLRKIYASLARGQYGRIEGEVPLEVSTYLLNTKREELLEIERQHNLFLSIKGHPGLIAGQSELTFHKQEEEPISVAEAIEAHPAQVSEESAAADSEAGENAEGTSRKKRKRRRRKKEPAVEAPQPPQEGVPEAAPAEISSSQSAPAPEEPQAEAEEVQEQATGASQEEEGKKKRRRRRRRKPAAQAEAEPASEATPAEPVAEPPSPVSAPHPAPVEASPSAPEEKQPVPKDENRPAPAAESLRPDEAVEEKPRRKPARKPQKAQKDVIFTFDFSLDEDASGSESSVVSPSPADTSADDRKQGGEKKKKESGASGRSRPSSRAGSGRRKPPRKGEAEGKSEQDEPASVPENSPADTAAASSGTQAQNRKKSGSRGEGKGRKSPSEKVSRGSSKSAARKSAAAASEEGGKDTPS